MLADLASALAARDPATAAHCACVTFLSRRLSAWLGWDEKLEATYPMEIKRSGQSGQSNVISI